jgi:Alpha/beta hydrolase domain
MLSRMPFRCFGCLVGILACAAGLLDARVVRVAIDLQKAVLKGRSFSGIAYERLTGRVYFSVSIANPHNRGIVDLQNAVNLKNGEVEFSSDFIAVRPTDPTQRNGSMLLEIPNGGRSRILALVDGGDGDLGQDAGDGFLRDFLYEGFNADENGEKALDGLLAHVAGAGRGSFNYRFAQPSRDAQPTSSIFFPTDVFPFTDLPETDPVTGEQGGLLDRATADGVVPKIFLSNTSYEYWGRAASLIHTTADGQHDASISPQVRIYHFTGLQHFSGPFPPVRGEGDLAGQEPESPLPVRYFWRSMIANMDTWVRSNKNPPPSSYPRIDDRTLLPFQNYAFLPMLNVPKPA